MHIKGLTQLQLYVKKSGTDFLSRNNFEVCNILDSTTRKKPDLKL